MMKQTRTVRISYTDPESVDFRHLYVEVPDWPGPAGKTVPDWVGDGWAWNQIRAADEYANPDYIDIEVIG